MEAGLMNTEQTWQSVLGQLQMEMPKASFDTWVRDTQVVSLEGGTLTIGVRNVYARDWLESRLTSTVSRLLTGIMNQSIGVRFVVMGTDGEGEFEGEDEELEDDAVEEDADLALEPVQWLDYDQIVQPHKQVVVKGYLRRLAMEIGPKAIWLYIGFHQAAWMSNTQGGSNTLRSRQVMRFSALSEGAFWRLLKQTEAKKNLSGLVERLDPPGTRRYRRGRDGHPHRIPIRYQVYMTPRLTRMDSAVIFARLQSYLERGGTLVDGLNELLATEDTLELLTPAEGTVPVETQCNTVMDIALALAGEMLTPEVEKLAQELHRRIVNCLGDIHLTHYFITQVIPGYRLTPAQAWLVTVARDLAYLNWRTGERRETVTFKGGYEEMAALVGSSRPKTVQAWLSPTWKSQQRGGDLVRFMQELDTPDQTYTDLRTGSMPRTFRVLLDEPLDANGSNRVDAGGGNKVDANGGNTLDAGGGNSQTQMEVIAGANGGNMVDANGGDLNTYKHLLNTNTRITSTTENQDTGATTDIPDFWELKTLLEQNDVHPKVQRELLEAQASVHAFVSWVLYAASPSSGRLSDPLGYALSRLRENPLKEARSPFRQLADLPPVELLELIHSTPQGSYKMPPPCDHPLAGAWKKVMGSNNHMLPAVQQILFGEGELEQ
jgi:hypothetical protein